MVDLADRLSDLSRSFERESGVADTLAAVVQAVVGTVPGAQHASISAVRKRREVETRAASSALAQAVDRAQYETEQGPCLDSLHERETVRLPLMERHEPTDAQAFERLVLASQHANRKLVDIAADLVRAGELPAVARRPPG